MGENRSRDIIVSVFDSDLLMRQILSSMLRKEKGLKLSDTSAFKGVDDVISKVKIRQPDVIMLGVDSLESDEMKLFYRLRREYPEVLIVLLTALNKQGASIALQGLKQGAIDYITKPDKRKGLILASRHFHKRVLALMRAVPRLNRERIRKHKVFSSGRTVTQNFTLNSGRKASNRVELIVIGSCLGGVTSLYKLVSELPENLPVPIIIVQHMPKIYTKELAHDLDEITPLNVREAQDSSPLLPGQVYVAPGGYHAVIKNEGNRKKISLHRGPREHKFRPSIDVMLRSALQTYDGKVLSIFLSGGGQDGVSGASMVMEQGGTVLLESKESSLLWDIGSKIKSMNERVSVISTESIVEEMIKMLKADSTKNDFKSSSESFGAYEFYTESFE